MRKILRNLLILKKVMKRKNPQTRLILRNLKILLDRKNREILMWLKPLLSEASEIPMMLKVRVNPFRALPVKVNPVRVLPVRAVKQK